MKTNLTLVLSLALSLNVLASSCSKSSCNPGEANCTCRDGNQCDTGGVCTNNTCTSPTLTGVTVSDSNARGCEVLITEATGTQVAFGKFSGGVVGTSVHEAPRTALTFVAPKDAALPGDGVQLALTTGTTAGLTVTKANCVDAKGARLPNATVTIH